MKKLLHEEHYLDQVRGHRSHPNHIKKFTKSCDYSTLAATAVKKLILKKYFRGSHRNC